MVVMDIEPSPELAGTEARSPWWQFVVILVSFMLIASSVEHAMGRRLFSASGIIRFWGGGPNSPENSQQFADWYSFSHLIHGFCLYAIASFFGRRKWKPSGRFLLAVALEASWEMIENSPIIIARYRQTVTTGYAGDTIFNSMSDILCAVIGYTIASRLPVWTVILLAVLMELLRGIVIHDGLVLNVIMLLHPFPAIKHWQAQ
jgi:hypothetical protein